MDSCGYLPIENDLVSTNVMTESGDSRFITVRIHITDYSSNTTVNSFCKGIEKEIVAYFDNVAELIELWNDVADAKSMGDVVDVAVNIWRNEQVENGFGMYKIYAGCKNMKCGFTEVMLAFDFTCGNEIVGGMRIAYGFSQIIMGVGELLDWR